MGQAQPEAPHFSSHHGELWYNVTACLGVTIYMSTLEKELTAATHVMQNSSNELSFLVSGKAKI